MTKEKNLPPLSPLFPAEAVAAQRTTLAFDVVGRFICSTWDEAVLNGGAPFDAVIIGSGMYGGYIADKLFRFGAAAGLRILVLEAGPFLVPEHLQNLPNLGLFEPGLLDPQDDNGQARNFVWGMPWRSNGVPFIGQAYCVGGKSVYWGGWCPRLEADDLQQWPQEAATYLEKNYEETEKQTGVFDNTDFIQGDLYKALWDKAWSVVPSGTLTKVEEPPLAVQGNGPASGLFGFDKFSSALLLFDAVRDAVSENFDDRLRRLFLVPNAHVMRLHADEGAVRQIIVQINGEVKSLDISPQCSVVFALGAIESTRLALQSVPNLSGPVLMGRNLMAHLRSNTLGRIRRSVLEKNGVNLPTKLQTAALLVRGNTADGKFHLQITASADPNPSPNQPGDADKLLFRMLPDIDQVDGILETQQADWISIWARGVGQKQGDKVSPVPRDSGNWINLSPFESDEFGIPRAFVRLEVSHAENRLWDAMDQAAIDFIKLLADGDSNNFAIDRKVRDSLGSTYHESGTLWMGTDPATSVTDTNGHFHHVSNAVCIDQAIFPAVGSVNPVLTGLTLTQRAAEQIVRGFNGNSAFASESGFATLFDGSPAALQNWQTTNGRAITAIGEILEVKDGPLALLYFKKQTFTNFTLRVQWKYFSMAANSGVFLRMPKDPPVSLVDNDPYYSRCIEVQIDQSGKNFDAKRTPRAIFGSSLHKTGAVYGVAPARCWCATQPSRDGTEGLWNNFEITADGQKISVVLNGTKVSEAQTELVNSGYIGLQYHTDRVQFRSIAIKEL